MSQTPQDVGERCLANTGATVAHALVPPSSATASIWRPSSEKRHTADGGKACPKAFHAPSAPNSPLPCHSSTIMCSETAINLSLASLPVCPSFPAGIGVTTKRRPPAFPTCCGLPSPDTASSLDSTSPSSYTVSVCLECRRRWALPGLDMCRLCATGSE